MKELAEYRINLIDRLVAATHEFRAACLHHKEPFASPKAGGWNVHQIAAHTRDVHTLVYGPRVRRTAVETNPAFENFDGEAHMAASYSADEPLQEILDALVTQVESLAEMLRALPSPAWARTSSHVMQGRGITLQAWVEKDLAHMEEHLKTVRNLIQ
jgi:hypothetical protein